MATLMRLYAAHDLPHMLCLLVYLPDSVEIDRAIFDLTISRVHVVISRMLKCFFLFEART